MLPTQADADETRPAATHLGLQFGGSAYVQVALRQRLVGPLIFEAGALPGLGFPAANASVGLSLELLQKIVSPFVSVGAGGGVGCGEEASPDPKDTKAPPKQPGFGCSGAAFQYSRLGLMFDLTSDRLFRITLDGGAWYGIMGAKGSRNRSFLWPMVGVGFYAPI